MGDDDVQVRDNPDDSRYEIRIDGRRAGFTSYRLHDNVADFVHTELDSEYEGRGLASELIGRALDDARRRDWQVLPTCEFVKNYIGKHDDYLDLVPAGDRARFGL